MTGRRRQWLAVVAIAITLVLFVLTPLLAAAGAPIELVVALSNISVVTLVASFALLVFVISRHWGWALWIGTLALGAEIAAAILLLIQEPQPAYLHPEWAWYWPVVNTLFFGRLLLARATETGFRVRFEAGGGTRDLDTAGAFAEAGASRFVVGTAAIDDPELIGRLVDRHADGLAVSVDARNGMVTTDGWTETTDIRAVDLMQRLAVTGVPTVIYTNVSIDGTLQGLDLASTEAVARAFGGGTTFFPGVGSLEDIAALGKLRHRGLRGVIVGRALYLGRFTLKDALRVARDGAAR